MNSWCISVLIQKNAHCRLREVRALFTHPSQTKVYESNPLLATQTQNMLALKVEVKLFQIELYF